ncbi:hypothetical protein A4U88_4377 [Serratia marcescens]|nr:hypothetical protein A4U88_4377 [Serratia marcescens]
MRNLSLFYDEKIPATGIFARFLPRYAHFRLLFFAHAMSCQHDLV